MIKYILFKDTDGETSMTFTVFVVGAFLSLVKFTFADFSVFGLTVVHMSGADCSMVIASLGGLYWGRKHTKSIPS